MEPARPVRLPAEVLLRPMRTEDVEAAERLSALAFGAARGVHGDEALRTPARAAAWCVRTAVLVQQDGPGCWVADHDGEVVGLATSWRRETLWGLATYAVRADWQGRGIGHALLEAAATHARGALRGMITSTPDPRAVRAYRRAGFDVHPQMTLEGTVAAGDLVRPRHVRVGTPGDREWMESLDRGLRGAGRGDHHVLLTEVHDLRVVDRPHRRGYAYRDQGGSVVLLAASDRRTASELLADALLDADGTTLRQPHVTAANQWALDVGLAAGLAVHADGYLCVRGLKPPTPYLHHGSLL